MATYSIIANRGDNELKWIVQAGVVGALGADQMALTFDRTTSLTKGDLYQFIEKLERFIPKAPFPPV